MKKIKILFLVLVLVFAFSITSRKKETAKSNYLVAIRLTDSPGPYNAIYIDLQCVEITGGNGNTMVLNVHPGIYNLLKFSKGIDTLI